MLKTKAIRFIKLNILLQPLLMIIGLLSSIFVIRELGTQIYANVVLLGAISSTISFLLSFGLMSTVTKLSIEFEDKNIRQAILYLTLIIQIFLIIFFISGIYFFPSFFQYILGGFSNNISSFGFVFIIASSVLSILSGSLLTAELDNKITYISSFFNSLIVPLWLIVSSFYSFDLSSILYGIIFINFCASSILFIGSLKYIGSFNIQNIFYINKVILKKYFNFLGTISFVRVYVYFASLPFLSLVLNYFNLYNELAYLAVILRIIGIISNVYGIPINKVSGVLFSNAFNEKNYFLMNKLYNLILKYNTFFYSLAFVGLFYFLNGFIEVVYLIKVDTLLLNLFILNILLSAILGVSNFITIFNEHYNIVFITSIISIIVFQYILWFFINDFGLYSIAFAMLLNTLIYSGIGMVYVAKRYSMIKIPLKFLGVVCFSSIIVICAGYVIDNYIVSLLINVILFLALFYICYKPSELDKKVLKEFLPKYLYSYLPFKYKLDNI